jgi:hypothetical protein
VRRTLRALKEISYWKPRLRLLDRWSIDFYKESPYTGQCSFGVENKEGAIYDWGKGRMPKDYIFHELLHMAMAVVRESKTDSERRENEEILVQDLSQVMLSLPASSMS